MDAGEAEAIALAMELGGVLLILDDKKARRVAQPLGLIGLYARLALTIWWAAGTAGADEQPWA